MKRLATRTLAAALAASCWAAAATIPPLWSASQFVFIYEHTATTGGLKPDWDDPDNTLIWRNGLCVVAQSRCNAVRAMDIGDDVFDVREALGDEDVGINGIVRVIVYPPREEGRRERRELQP